MNALPDLHSAHFACEVSGCTFDADHLGPHEPELDGSCTEPHLGLATTRELLAELAARIEVDGVNGGGGLDYRTADGDRPSRDRRRGHGASGPGTILEDEL